MTDKPAIIKPAVSFEEITFSDGHSLSLESDEVVVFVGPNNAGKSAALRELQNFMINSAGARKVIKSAILSRTGSNEDLKRYLDQFAQKSDDPTNLSYMGLGYAIHHSHVQFYASGVNHFTAPFFSTRLSTEDRITASNPAGAIALFENPPTHPIHILMTDPSLSSIISSLFRRAFNKDLFVFRAGGANFPLYVGDKPQPVQGQDELSKDFVDRSRASCETLHSQGDGMRSFATVLLYTLVADHHSIQFLDEPEAFLHPPQARLLGEYLAKNRKTNSQLFISTHSTDILDGLISQADSKIRIVRLQRFGNVNHIRELSKERTKSIANDTLTRFSRVLDGIFVQHVIITESDADCLFYNSILGLKDVSGDLQPDVLFIHASGKHRMEKLSDTLRSLDVPVSVIADIDVLDDVGVFRGLFEALGGVWANVESSWKIVKEAVEKARPPLNASQIKGLLEKEIEALSGTAPISQEVERKVKAVFKTNSPWSAIKQSGRSGLIGAQAVQSFDKLCDSCADVGLFILQVGEIEGFCRSVGGHGPSYVEKVLQSKDLENDEELNEARAFIRRVWLSTISGKMQKNSPSGEIK